MAAQALTRAALPGHAELRSFAHAAAHLLVERMPRASGARVVTRRAGVGLQHLDHRDYAAGDEVRHIDWRQTARRQRTVVRRFESESVADWTLLLDSSSSMAVNSEAKWRAALLVAAAMSYALTELGHRVGLLVFGTRVLAECPRGRGLHHYAAIARMLSQLQPPRRGERSSVGACARQLKGASSVFAISDGLFGHDTQRELAPLLQRCTDLHLVQVSDGAETHLAETGPIDLVDVETGARLRAFASEQASELAAAERRMLTARLREFCSRSGIAFTDWDLTTPWQQMLIRHLVRARTLG